MRSFDSGSRRLRFAWDWMAMDVLGVERGTRIDMEVNFSYPDAWPTPESGILFDKGVFPFQIDIKTS